MSLSLYTIPELYAFLDSEYAGNPAEKTIISNFLKKVETLCGFSEIEIDKPDKKNKLDKIIELLTAINDSMSNIDRRQREAYFNGQ